ncbi:MAG: amino acid ABC transporter substrate-binding protein [Desulfobacterales bacterium]|jgi:general L-amino acid transport system substrate-binding protein|nr:amino acid ABC transporter substrate-binding protein [Desulfobacterales bacterium]
MRSRLIRIGSFFIAGILAGTSAFFSTAQAGEILARVQSNGVLRCGVSEGIAGFSIKDGSGRWSGMDVDFCRAVAAAVLNDGEKVVFVPLFASARFPALKANRIDLLARNTTQTLGREVNIGTHFGGILYYDGQSFIVPAGSRVQRVRDLEGATICVLKESSHVAHLADYFTAHGLSYQPLIVDSITKAKEDLYAGRCQAYTSDASILASVRVEAPGGPEGFRILPDRISKEPFGPVVNRGDEQWFALVKWVLFALIEAEERGITRENVRQVLQTTTDPAQQAFLDKGGGYAKAMDINPGWVVRIVETIGNYGEMFERNLGARSGLNIDRGLNRLWNQGGLMYSPPFR